MSEENRVYVDLDALAFNFRAIKNYLAERKETKILAVVKADAYGHGAKMIARELERLDVDYLGVVSVDEGASIRKEGVVSPILVLGKVSLEDAERLLKFRLTPSVFDIETVKALEERANALGRGISVHVKIDTGMSRLGIPYGEALNFFKSLKQYKGIRVEGLFSHLACSDDESKEGDSFTLEQIRRFNEIVEGLRTIGFPRPVCHLANSAGVLRFPQAYLDMVRVGILIYGIYPFSPLKRLISVRPLMSLKTKIIFLKRVPTGEAVSYGRTFLCSKDSLIAVLPIGYSYGFKRGLSNSGYAIIRGKKAPIVGRICMDMTMVDVSEIPGVTIGDEVLLLGRTGLKEIPVEDIAQRTETIPYEIITTISNRVPRIYLKGGKELEG